MRRALKSYDTISFVSGAPEDWIRKRAVQFVHALQLIQSGRDPS